MEIIKLLEDFEQLRSALLKHPYLIDFPEFKDNFQALASKQAETISDFDSFLDAATALTCFFSDGHTNLELPYNTSDLCIPISCNWNCGKLLVSKKYASIPIGAELIAVENQTIDHISARLAARIPHENLYLVKSRMVEYPYKNYHLFSSINLALLFGTKTKYEITYRYTDKLFTVSLPLVCYNAYLDFDDSNYVSWEINDGNALLKLDACICDQSYKSALKELAHACREQNVTALTLDLSSNMGGTSEVIEQFLGYVDVDSFRRYEMVDYSGGSPVCICSRAESVRNDKQPILFPQRIYCKVGHSTFSSARTFAVTLKDNGIATIIGEPTGGKPSSYGMPKKYTLNNTGIRFRVSRAWFGRPNASLDHTSTLEPTT